MSCLRLSLYLFYICVHSPQFQLNVSDSKILVDYIYIASPNRVKSIQKQYEMCNVCCGVCSLSLSPSMSICTHRLYDARVGHSWLNMKPRTTTTINKCVQFNFGHNKLSKNRLDTNIPHRCSINKLKSAKKRLHYDLAHQAHTHTYRFHHHQNLIICCHILIRLRLSFCNLILMKFHASFSSNLFDRSN